ncbi:hypothetical protein LTR22_027495 [Elasticomyces elasticus]|nr:hypothetical protein LTR22_027495 [Elasticomyces elasticus]
MSSGNTDSVARTVGAYAHGLNLWTPAPALNRTDADVTLMILAQNSVGYDVPCDDPWLSAHIDAGDWLADNYFSTLGCIDQHQFCNPNLDASNGGCTSLTGSTTIVDEAFAIATASRILTAVRWGSIHDSVNGRGASALLASETCFHNGQPGLPNNQWQIEVDAWFATSLARLQQSVVEYVFKPTNLPPGVVSLPETDIPGQIMCRSQKVKAGSGFQNISLLGVVIIVLVGTVLILGGLTVDKIGSLVQRLLMPHAPERLAWALDEKCQLQRMAFEGAHWTGWKHCQESVPVTLNATTLGRYGQMHSQHSSIMPPTGELKVVHDHEEQEIPREWLSWEGKRNVSTSEHLLR